VSIVDDDPFPQSLPGVVARSTSWGMRSSLTTGPADIGFTYAARPLVPIMGDWDGDGVKTAGTYEAGTFKLQDAVAAGAPECVFTFCDPRGYPVVGDFDGDGRDDVAVFRNGTWQLHYSDDGATSGFAFGSGAWPSVVPVAGDWNGDGVDGIGYYCLANTICPAGTWNLRNTASAGGPDAGTFTLQPRTQPVPCRGRLERRRRRHRGSERGHHLAAQHRQRLERPGRHRRLRRTRRPAGRLGPVAALRTPGRRVAVGP
jgi:hypothetical protein